MRGFSVTKTSAYTKKPLPVGAEALIFGTTRLSLA